ncbi:tetratricopeptide repeat protein [Phenylobacterium sp. VNQ135]|uniref:tetratricopeptide repeat protein n=1 Tax=Phenylobacterium sp. VNQ135 TaxID=3400922 RepID=UPI003C019EF0
MFPPQPPAAPGLDLFGMAVGLMQQGRLGEAERLFRTVIAQEPQHAEALHALGLIAYRAGRPPEALELLTRALKAAPKSPQVLGNRGLVHAALERFKEALADYDRALALNPLFAEAAFNRANALTRMGRLPIALQGYDKAIALAPQNAAWRAARAELLRRMEREDEAVEGYREAVSLDPTLGSAQAALGDLLLRRGELDAAAEALARAAELDPTDAVTAFNLGNVKRRQGRVAEAVESYGRAVDIDPDFAMAHQNRAVCRMLLGDWANDAGMGGFDEYAWRHRCPGPELRDYPEPAFDGSQDLAGKTLLIYPELFLGDLVHFGRYAKLAEDRGASVILAAPRILHALLSTLSPTIRLIGKDDAPPAFDLHCALMDLPRAFGVTPDDVKAAAPYLQAEAERVDRWRSRMGEGGFRIGVCWQGSTRAGADLMGRSFRLAELASVAALPGVRLISLQKHDGLDQLAALPSGMHVETLGDDFDEGPDAFLDTAAAVQACDLVITADTAVAHVAGAVGARTWIPLPAVPDWRWLLGREDTPWYPDTRLFRQSAARDWTPVFARMTQELSKELA